MKSNEFLKPLRENVTGGATGAGSVAVSMSQEGKMPTQVIKRQQEYAKNSFQGMKTYQAGKK